MLLWISIPDLYFIHRRHRPNFHVFKFHVLRVNDAHEIQFCSTTFFQIFFFQDRDQDQDFTLKINNKSYALCFKDTHHIWCRSANFFSKSKSCSRSGSGCYFRFQYQTYISYIEDTDQILFGSANSFENYCVHSESPRTYVQQDNQTDRWKFFLFARFVF